MTRAGTTSDNPPAPIPASVTASRPRLKAIASSNGSNADSSAVTRTALASKRTGKLREAELVHTKIVGDATALVGEILTCRAARVQWMTSRAMLVASRKRASLPPATAW